MKRAQINDSFSTTLKLNDFFNLGTLNIFSDASILKSKVKYNGCYGVVAVCGDHIIDEDYRIATETTVNESEIKGVRGSLRFALKYGKYFQKINIFSDSQVSIFGIRDYIYKWTYVPSTGVLLTSTNKPVSNQEIFVECLSMLQKPELEYKINIWHQSGHVENNYDQLCHAANVFSKSNNIYGKIDLNLIRYISTYNNFVDRKSRQVLKNTRIESSYMDPVYAIPREWNI